MFNNTSLKGLMCVSVAATSRKSGEKSCSTKKAKLHVRQINDAPSTVTYM